MMNPVKVTIGVVTFMSTIAIVYLKYGRVPKVDGTNKDEYMSKRIEWEYFEALPKRFAASYYPFKQTHEKTIIEPIFKTEAAGSINITFLINSKVGNVARRKTVRNTWGSVRTFKGINLHHIFVVGTNEDLDMQESLKSEAEKYGDILQVNVPDDFANSPKKSLSAFRWIRTSPQLHTKFYVTTLDNCVVNIAKIIKFITEHEKEIMQSIHCGFMFENNTAVIRGTGPRSVPKELYPKGTYPPFCRQNLVILSLSYVERIHQVSLSTNISGFHLEDVLLFGILREKLDEDDSIKNIKNGGIRLVYYPWDESDNVLLKMKLKWKDWKIEMYKEVVSKSPK